MLARARELAAELAQAPTLTMAMAKRQLTVAQNQTLDEALNAECVMQALMSQSEDHREGGAAFREKRKPSYKGK